MQSIDGTTHFALDHEDMDLIIVCHSGRDCWPAKAVAA
ncbi:hypothetical protein G4_54 [Propionibacterium phage G4]|uniref:Uncharacterized protein n=1 Tax=Propionibacterium phage G4 TaxID=1897537 RepID=A0A1D8EUD0_9CAUD|nr:hypothetical protein FDH12_gp54 [Propionibacterium phage G4]AOT24643.1 hypothetical protein G4_54 [Propionibacterium phage G4]